MEYKTIKEVAKINPENITKSYNKDYIMYLDTSNITNGTIDEIVKIDIKDIPSRAKRIVRENDIIYSTVRPNLCHYGILRNIIDNLIVSTGFAVIRCDETKVLPEYLYAYLTLPSITERLHAIAETSTSAYPSIRPSDLENMTIPVPDIEVQKRISKMLSSLDKKIELNNQINDNLLKLNNQLYEEYFINNVDGNTHEVYLKDLIKVVNGYSYKGSELADKSDIGLATIKNFERKGGFKEDGFKPLNPQKIKKEQIVEKNDILVACTDLTQQADIIGNAVLLLGKVEYEIIIISMDLVKIIPKENIDKYVVFSILNSREFKNFALGYKSGTTVLHLNKKCFDDFIIKLPANDKLDIFSKMIKTNYEKISNILEENRRLEKLRDTLLPKLMNGEIDLDKVEI